MAERTRLSIAAGERATHRLAWAEEGKPDRLGSLQWSVHVLDDLDVELGVTVEWGPGSEGLEGEAEAAAVAGIPPLQEVGRSIKFQGTFVPKNALLGAPRGVQTIVFNLSNEFAWFSSKEVEIVTLLERDQGPPMASVPPLPPLAPLPPPPRSGGSDGAAQGGSADESACAATPELRAPPPAGAEGQSAASAEEIFRFGEHLDALLAAAEERRPTASGYGEEVPWLEELLSHVATLRGLCQRRPLPVKAEAEAEAARPAELDELGADANAGSPACDAEVQEEEAPLVEESLGEAEQRSGISPTACAGSPTSRPGSPA